MSDPVATILADLDAQNASPGRTVVRSEEYQANSAAELARRRTSWPIMSTDEFSGRMVATRADLSAFDATSKHLTDDLPTDSLIPSLVPVVSTDGARSVKLVEEDVSVSGNFGLDAGSDPSTDASAREITADYDAVDKKLIRWAAGAGVREDAVDDEAAMTRLVSRAFDTLVMRRLGDSILNGDGTSTGGRQQLDGILNRANVGSIDRSTDSRVDVLVKAAKGLQVTAQPRTGRDLALVAHPEDLEALRLEKDASDHYTATALPHVAPDIKRYVPSIHVTSGSPVLGDWSTCTLFMRRGFKFGITNSHEDRFTTGWLTATFRSELWLQVARAGDGFTVIENFG